MADLNATTMSTPQAKRRRLNTATKTLHKPFKSPFRTPLKAAATDLIASETPDTAAASIVARDYTSTRPTGGKVFEPSPIPNPSASRLPVSTPTRPLHHKRPISTTATPTPKLKPSLTRDTINLRADIQLLTQALSLCTSTKDEDLAVLVDRWRTASRAAAEEVYAGTRDRVNRMGGVGAWKSREKEQMEWRTKWDKEEAEAEMERRKAMEEPGEGDDVGGFRDRYEEYGDADQLKNGSGEQNEACGNDDDSFTMDMMLKTLHIDLKLIGYDKEGQRWDG
ncbi:hypothetical protein K504DRAFT_424947 [Pleomassaria siparia CBS 279.74]|uniref:DNA repair protein Dds20/Mei5 n=1 Tax=Pleomassaria siparia CBS 279.74 TaxID=1314801 RepID=A0A6G1KMZ4_9PLEO|nr:hypothetical protein K504DRAFT_424947 [Pleomassaria siparia CBS 279.74]